ncbi:MAG: hypothetical protein G8345_05460 [Magnetococcales bacterium]|nr:hypothetical protein [Magnetococcales bacterium]
MELANGSRVAILGGGPAGSFTACFMLDLARRLSLQLEVDIYEPRGFYQCGPVGCNMCGGIISESLVQNLATEGLHLSPNMVLETINTYTLHTDYGSVDIGTPLEEMRIAAIFRGGGPRGAENQKPLPWDGFDWFMLQKAVQQGARHLPHRVAEIHRDGDGKPRLLMKNEGGRVYDLLVGAPGINNPASLRLFENMDFGYQPPKMMKAFIAEWYMGAEDVQERLGHVMHIFLLHLPGLMFAALTPKGPYATLVILGEGADEELANRLCRTPQMQALLPPNWQIPVQPCQCQPHIYIGAAKNPFGDRVVMVGDAGVSRLYKDGIGAAFRTAKACANTALTRGVAKEHFQRHYWPACQEMERDNLLGHGLFKVDGLLGWWPLFRHALLGVVRWEQNHPFSQRHLSRALWNTFTGSAAYTDILLDLLHPTTMGRFCWEVVKQAIPGSRSS